MIFQSRSAFTFLFTRKRPFGRNARFMKILNLKIILGGFVNIIYAPLIMVLLIAACQKNDSLTSPPNQNEAITQKPSKIDSLPKPISVNAESLYAFRRGLRRTADTVCSKMGDNKERISFSQELIDLCSGDTTGRTAEVLSGEWKTNRSILCTSQMNAFDPIREQETIQASVSRYFSTESQFVEIQTEIKAFESANNLYPEPMTCQDPRAFREYSLRQLRR